MNRYEGVAFARNPKMFYVGMQDQVRMIRFLYYAASMCRPTEYVIRVFSIIIVLHVQHV